MRPHGSSSFLREAAFGFVLAVAAAAAALTLSFALPTPIVARVVVAGAALAYLLRTLARANERTGRVVCVALWLAATCGAWWLGVGLPGFVLLHVAAIWLVRSLYAYSTFVEAALDLGLSALAMSFAVWAGVRTESLFLAVWCFFLIAAMHVAVPSAAAALTSRAGSGKENAAGDDANRNFTEALRAAHAALERMAARS